MPLGHMNEHEYGLATNWAKETPLLWPISKGIHHVRNFVFSLPLLNKIGGVAEKVI